MSLATEAMIVNLQIGTWRGYRLDKRKGEEISSASGAEMDAAHVNKHLVGRTELKRIEGATWSLRKHFYSRTLPWKDSGDRLLPRRMYMRFMEEHVPLVDTFKNEVEDFVTRVYPAVRHRAEFRMGDMFDPLDYPAPAELRRKLFVKLDVDAISDSADFRVKLDEEQAERVRGDIEASMKERYTRAAYEPWRRLTAELEHFVARMSDSDGAIHASTLNNLSGLADILPALNITNDPQIDVLATQIHAMLTGVDIKRLRKDDAAKLALSEEATKIIENMHGFMQAFAS